MAIRHDKANDPAAAAEVEHPLPCLWCSEMGRQNGIHRKTVTLPVLPADQAAGKEGVIGGFDVGWTIIAHGVFVPKSFGRRSKLAPKRYIW
jgi:hypothetical protein